MRSRTVRSLALLALAALAATPGAADPLTLEVAAPDGVRLAATYVSPGAPGPGVLLLHMCNSTRSAWSPLAAALAARGIHSLAFDYRGYGGSGGERDLTNPVRQQQIAAATWPGDIDAAFAELARRPGVDPGRLAAAGGSCGVNQSIQLARRHPGQVKALALLAGTTNREGDLFLQGNPWLPLLGVASLDDAGAVELTRWTLGFSSHAGNRFREYPRGGHGTELFAVHADLVPALADWFEEHLVRRPVAVPAEVVARPGPSAAIWNAFVAPGGVADLTARLRAARGRGEALVLPSQAAVNAEGYERLAAGDTAGAIELLAFNVEANPSSANALDSLGDAYLAAGDAERAAELARRTLEALPSDESLHPDFHPLLRRSAEAKLAPARPPA